jgi:redox-sensitive bicupin YhaK (pirin superfamily)
VTTAPVELRRASTRFHTELSWLDSWHSFSFGSHFDPDEVGFGLLVVNNDDRVAAGGGFGTHGHRDMEIVTWVLDGELEHRDSAGHEGVIYRGLAQRMSAGSGIQHSELNHSRTAAVHFLQMWVPPDTHGIAPGYEQLDCNAALDAGGLVAVASGRGHDGAVRIHQRAAVMWVARLADDEIVALPDAPFVHAFVASGSIEVGGVTLDAGDAARLRELGSLEVRARSVAEIVVWEMEEEVQR